MEENISTIQGKTIIDQVARSQLDKLLGDELVADSVKYKINEKLNTYVSSIHNGGTNATTEISAVGNLAHGMTSSLVEDEYYFLGSSVSNETEEGRKYSAQNVWSYIKGKIKLDQASGLPASSTVKPDSNNLIVIQNGVLTKTTVQSVINSSTNNIYDPNGVEPINGKGVKEAIDSVIGTDTYTTCNSKYGEINKTATVSYFKLQQGVTIYVKFKYMNTAYNPTLSVNNTGAKFIKIGNTNIQPGWLQANKVYSLVYDGVDYQVTNLVNNTNTFTYRPLSEVTGGINNNEISEILSAIKQNFINPKALAYLSLGLGDYYISPRFDKYLLAGFNHYAGSKRNSPDKVKDEIHISEDTKGNGLGFLFISSGCFDNGDTQLMGTPSSSLFKYTESDIYKTTLPFLLSTVETEIGHPLQNVGRRIPYNSGNTKSFETINSEEIEEKLFIPTEFEIYGHSFYGCENLSIHQNNIFPIFSVAPQIRILSNSNKPYWLASPSYYGSDGNSYWCTYNSSMSDSNILQANDTNVTLRVCFYL